MENIYYVEGKNITDLNSLYKEFARAVEAPNEYFGKCLQSFDDCLFGGFGLQAPCKIIWRNSEFSRKHLNSCILKEYYENLIKKNSFMTEEGKEYVLDAIESAKNGEKSMFDEVVELIESVTERAEFIENWTVDLVLE